ncbi:MAG: NlpC/P60 family protein, partial [Alphaproteobacteria bacterium]|nr:NlpC/P60 family protein [Alphaproteobacteria bacterium]
DCSGLVQIALSRCGVAAPRDSDMMEAKLGEPVAYDGDESVLRRGDLVFWKGHMGIWIASDRFLHANWTDMRVWASPFQQVVDHIHKAEGLPVSAVRRL